MKAYVEDEYHFLLKCPLLNDLRGIYLAPKYTTNPNMHKFVLLMTSNQEQDICNIATYIYMAYVKRRSILNEQSIDWYVSDKTIPVSSNYDKKLMYMAGIYLNACVYFVVKWNCCWISHSVQVIV